MRKTIYEPAYQTLIGKLRAARRRRGLRQQDVATRLGVTRSWISKVESHEVRVDVIQLVRLAHVCGLQAHRLVKEVEERERITDDSGTQDGALRTGGEVGMSDKVTSGYTVGVGRRWYSSRCAGGQPSSEVSG